MKHVAIPNEECPICHTPLNQRNVNRWEASHPNKPEEIRLDSIGRAWCNGCTEKHDSIDWEEVYNG